ncbi:MAG: peptidylprolyl isomerase [Planctomycetes bacterium]|nr:peptidylprolyl isomerase [Planctomycetota bacterium]
MRRGDERHGRGLLLRQGRSLFVSYESTFSAFAFGVRLRVRDQSTARTITVLVTPLHPPLSPMSGFLERPDATPERLDMSLCDLRMELRHEKGFCFEARIPLDLLEMGRGSKAYQFTAEGLDLARQKIVAVYPHVTEGALAGQTFATLLPSDHWGLDVPIGTPTPQPALELLHQLEAESIFEGGGRIGETPPEVFLAFTGSIDGQREQPPLEALEARIRELVAAYPDYLSLRANLVRVQSHLNRPESALETMASIRRDFPEILLNEREVLVRVQLLRDLGRYAEALETLEGGVRELGPFPGADRERLVLRALARNWEYEKKIRAEEAERDDLPRVRFKTSIGDVVLELFEDDAPNAVASFLSLCKSKAYDGTRFHWALSGRWVFGGDPNSRNEDPSDDGFGDPGYLIEPEPGRRLNWPMTIALTEKRRTRRSEGCTFVFNLTPAPDRDGMCTVFGRVLEGAEVLRRLGYYDTLESTEIIRKRDHPYPVVTR